LKLIWLKETTDYAIDPEQSVWAAMGTGTHYRLSIHRYTYNVLSEERLKDEQSKGIADVVEENEEKPGTFILTDYKTWGSFKVAKALGIITVDQPVGVYKNGKPKTKKVKLMDPNAVDLRETALQLNRYRIFFESYGFPISKMQVQAMPRDGGTYVATNRGIDKNLILIDVPWISNEDVMNYYEGLALEVGAAFKIGYARMCDAWEAWDGRRCQGWCEVADACKKLAMENKERWPVK